MAAFHWASGTRSLIKSFFFTNVPATTEIYTLSLHDALPIYYVLAGRLRANTLEYAWVRPLATTSDSASTLPVRTDWIRSEEHTSELQSQSNLVCRLLLEKKKKHNTPTTT